MKPVRVDNDSFDVEPCPWWITLVLGLYPLAVSLLAVAALVWVTWTSRDSESLRVGTIQLSGEGFRFTVVLASSGIGSMVHAIMSFTTYVGNRTFRKSWVSWYLMRPIIGAMVATLLYCALRAGLSPGASAGNTGIYGLAALGGLAGLFSKQASDKLEEIFDVAFQTRKGYGDSVRLDKLPDQGREEMN
jgi:hypothetical protein